MRQILIVFLTVGILFAWQWSDILGGKKSHVVRKVQRPPMEDLLFEKHEAFAQINAIRLAMGMPTLQENKALARAAQAHADYLVRHHASSHFEKAGMEGFSGTKPLDRALQAGYSARFVGENLSTKNPDALHSVDGLFSAIYHRFGFLDPAYDELGIGIAQSREETKNSAFVYEMGNSEINRLCQTHAYRGSGQYVYGICADTRHRIDAAQYREARNEIKERNPKIIVYPYEGQKEVPPAFYNEHPDPLPEYDVSGFPVSVEFNDRYFRKVDLVSFRLYDAKGNEVRRVRLLDKQKDPNGILTRRQFALLPLERLEYGTTYRAKIVYRHRQKEQTKRWSFTTRRAVEALKVIRNRETSLTLKAGRGYWLYFPPANPRDLIKTMRYPEHLFVEFIDNNTMRIVLDSDEKRDFTIEGSGRKVHVTVR